MQSRVHTIFLISSFFLLYISCFVYLNFSCTFVMSFVFLLLILQYKQITHAHKKKQASLLRWRPRPTSSSGVARPASTVNPSSTPRTPPPWTRRASRTTRPSCTPPPASVIYSTTRETLLETLEVRPTLL